MSWVTGKAYVILDGFTWAGTDARIHGAAPHRGKQECRDFLEVV